MGREITSARDFTSAKRLPALTYTTEPGSIPKKLAKVKCFTEMGITPIRIFTRKKGNTGINLKENK